MIRSTHPLVASNGLREEKDEQMRLHPRTLATKPVSSTGCMHVCTWSRIKPRK